MRKILARVDDGRFGRAIAGLVTQSLVTVFIFPIGGIWCIKANFVCEDND